MLCPDLLIFLCDLCFQSFSPLKFKSLKPLFQPHQPQEGIKRNQLRRRDTAPLCGYPMGIELAGVPGDQHMVKELNIPVGPRRHQSARRSRHSSCLAFILKMKYFLSPISLEPFIITINNTRFIRYWRFYS